MTIRSAAVVVGIALTALIWACAEFTLVTAPDDMAGIDSVDVYPDSIRLAPGDTVQLTAVAYDGDSIVECSGACDTVPGISADQVVPFQKVARIE